MRTKFSGILTLFLAFIVQLTFAQDKLVTGTVVDDASLPLPGVNVIIKGTNTGTQTDFDGNFSVNASVGQTLVFSFVGFQRVEIPIGASDTYNVTLQQGAAELDEVVVTAQGIKKEKKALGYAVATISADQVSAKPSTDVARALTGKAPGVNIQQTSGLSGSGTNIIIRGFSSINGSNQPLFVVDGVPFNADTNNDRGFVGGGASASSRFLDIDPNNVAEINVLKGLAATTLYGQAGRNGVILITTIAGSSGETNKKFEIAVNQSFFFNQIANLPDYQDNYGNGFYQVYSQAFSNWGPNFNVRGRQGIAEDGTIRHPYDRASLAAAFPEFQGARYEYRAYDSVEDFFNTGAVVSTSLNATGGGENTSYSVGFGRTQDEGFVESNDYQRINFQAGGSAKLSNNFTVSSSFNYVRTDRDAPPTAAGFGSNPVGGNASLFSNVLYTPRSVDLTNLPFENPITNESVSYRAGNDIQNPYWTQKYILDSEAVRRFYGNVSVQYDVTDKFNITYRVGLDNYTQFQEFSVNRGGPQIPDGSLQTSFRINNIWDHTLNFNYSTDFAEKLSFDATLGFNPRNEERTFRSISSTQQVIFGLIDHDNFETTTANSFIVNSNIIGAYFSGTLGYDNYLYLNLQGRNDVYSSLEDEERSIFYPSASISFIPTSAIASFRDSDVLNYLKIRAGFGSSAGFPDPYATRIGLQSTSNNFIDVADGSVVNTLSIPGRLGNRNLKPELISEIEAGIEARLFNNRLGFEATVYRKDSRDLILQNRQLDPASGFTVIADNPARVSNEGIEIGFNINPIRGANESDFRWDISGQYTINENIVEELGLGIGPEGTPIAGFTNLGNFAIAGEAYGVIQGSSITRDANGNLVVGSDGSYLPNTDLTIIADPNADWRATVINEFSYKGFSLGAQIEYTHGGDIYSTTAAALISRGLVEDTDFDRTQTFILPGVKQDGTPNDIQIAATDVGFENSGFFIDEQAIYDATTIRLREVSLSYEFPKKSLERTPFGSFSISVIGQNLFYKAVNFPDSINFDPEVLSLGVGNGQGFDFLTGPTSRRFGFSLNLTF